MQKMSDRYFGKVVKVRNEYMVVINKGYNDGVKEGQIFLIIGLGDMIYDPDSGEELEQLEIVRGKAKVTHAQKSIATLESSEYERGQDEKRIKKTHKGASNIAAILGQGATETEEVIPGEVELKELKGVVEGDYVILCDKQ